MRGSAWLSSSSDGIEAQSFAAKSLRTAGRSPSIGSSFLAMMRFKGDGFVASARGRKYPSMSQPARPQNTWSSSGACAILPACTSAWVVPVASWMRTGLP